LHEYIARNLDNLIEMRLQDSPPTNNDSL
jgi:hypothetical protein